MPQVFELRDDDRLFLIPNHIFPRMRVLILTIRILIMIIFRL